MTTTELVILLTEVGPSFMDHPVHVVFHERQGSFVRSIRKVGLEPAGVINGQTGLAVTIHLDPEYIEATCKP